MAESRKRSTVSKSDSVGYGEDRNFEDPPGYEDGITDEELLEDIFKDKPSESSGLESVVIVDGLPMNIQPGDRFEKLKTFVRKIIAGHTKCDPTKDIVNELFAVDDNGTQGYAFFEFSNKEFAKRAVENMNNHPLDKQHILSVDYFAKFDEYITESSEWQEPEMRPYKDVGNLWEYMEQEDCYDQYIMTQLTDSDEPHTAVCLNTPVESVEIYGVNNWYEKGCTWSPMGTYLATLHVKGVALWGGKTFGQITRFAHKDVESVHFSPKERYILTIRRKPDYLQRDDEAMILWDVVTSARKKDFVFDQRDQNPFQPLGWSPDENYYALLSKHENANAISVHETKTFALLGKEPIKIPGLVNFSWSPTQNVIAYWVKEAVDVPARLGLLEIPSKSEKRTKQLFSVIECQFYWQKNGEYMAVKVQRYKKKVKKERPEGYKGEDKYDYTGIFYNLEIFTLTGKKEVPVESVEIKDQILDVAWEPNGNKLVVLTASENQRFASFYSGRQGQDLKFELTKKIALRHPCDKISWSPMGQYLVLHSLAKQTAGYLTFVDAADIAILNDQEYFLLRDVYWDPTGRYLTVTTGGSRRDTGFTLFTFQGRFVRSEKIDGLSFFSWRPRPVTLLSAERQKEIRKNLKKFAVDFEAKDKIQMNRASREVAERRRKQMEEFQQVLDMHRRLLEKGKRKLLELRNGFDPEAEDESVQELVEEQLEVMTSQHREEISR